MSADQNVGGLVWRLGQFAARPAVPAPGLIPGMVTPSSLDHDNTKQWGRVRGVARTPPARLAGPAGRRLRRGRFSRPAARKHLASQAAEAASPASSCASQATAMSAPAPRQPFSGFTGEPVGVSTMRYERRLKDLSTAAFVVRASMLGEVEAITLDTVRDLALGKKSLLYKEERPMPSSSSPVSVDNDTRDQPAAAAAAAGVSLQPSTIRDRAVDLAKLIAGDLTKLDANQSEVMRRIVTTWADMPAAPADAALQLKAEQCAAIMRGDQQGDDALHALEERAAALDAKAKRALHGQVVMLVALQIVLHEAMAHAAIELAREIVVTTAAMTYTPKPVDQAKAAQQAQAQQPKQQVGLRKRYPARWERVQRTRGSRKPAPEVQVLAMPAAGMPATDPEHRANPWQPAQPADEFVAAAASPAARSAGANFDKSGFEPPAHAHGAMPAFAWGLEGMASFHGEDEMQQAAELASQRTQHTASMRVMRTMHQLYAAPSSSGDRAPGSGAAGAGSDDNDAQDGGDGKSCKLDAIIAEVLQATEDDHLGSDLDEAAGIADPAERRVLWVKSDGTPEFVAPEQQVPAHPGQEGRVEALDIADELSKIAMGVYDVDQMEDRGLGQSQPERSQAGWEHSAVGPGAAGVILADDAGPAARMASASMLGSSALPRAVWQQLLPAMRAGVTFPASAPASKELLRSLEIPQASGIAPEDAHPDLQDAWAALKAELDGFEHARPASAQDEEE